MLTIPIFDGVAQGAHKLRVNPKKVTTIKIEPPVQFSGKIDVVRVSELSIGAFSYLVSGRICSDMTIGRYCSIAHDFDFGGVNHPTDWVSTSPVQYNRTKFAWHPVMDGFVRKPVPARKAKATYGGGIVVGNDVWIGAHVIIARGVTIGTGAIVAGGAVVTKDVPPYTVVGGVPAKPIRKRFSDATADRLLASEWWNLHPSVLSGVDFSNPKNALEIFENAKDKGADLWQPPISVRNFNK